jgi:hypothetical protein
VGSIPPDGFRTLTPLSLSYELIASPLHSAPVPQRYGESQGTQSSNDYRPDLEPNTCFGSCNTPLGCASIPESLSNPYSIDHLCSATNNTVPSAKGPAIKRFSGLGPGKHPFRSSEPGTTKPRHLPTELLHLAIEQPHDVTQASWTLPKPKWTSY